MSYTKQNFKSKEKLYASDLNEMDEQIYQNTESINQLSEEISDLKENGTGTSGLTDTVKTLLMTVLKNAVFTSNQSANLTALEKALKANSGGDNTNPDGGGNTDSVVMQVADTLYIVSGVEVNKNASILTIM